MFQRKRRGNPTNTTGSRKKSSKKLKPSGSRKKSSKKLKPSNEDDEIFDVESESDDEGSDFESDDEGSSEDQSSDVECITDADLKGSLHTPGCLSRHITPFKEDDTCSHRWQAYLKAKKNHKTYDYPAYESLCKKGTYEGRGGEDRDKSKYESFFRLNPKKNDWDIGKSNKNDKREDIENFTKSSMIPYWHNAHHIIPYATLRNFINSFDRHSKIIVSGLNNAEYNINDQDNMIILPQEQPVAEALKLPRHLTLNYSTKIKEEYCDHPVYSKKILEKLDCIAQTVNEEIDNHLEDALRDIKFSDTKSQLEQISTDTYEEIIKKGKSSKGDALDDLFNGDNL